MNAVLALFSRVFVVFAVAIAMGTSGFAHRAAAVEPDEGLQTYVAAGGSLSDLCGDLDPLGKAGGQTCDACRLVDTAVVPTHMSGCHQHEIGPIELAFSGAASTELKRSLDPSRPVRAPPTV